MSWLSERANEPGEILYFHLMLPPWVVGVTNSLPWAGTIRVHSHCAVALPVVGEQPVKVSYVVKRQVLHWLASFLSIVLGFGFLSSNSGHIRTRRNRRVRRSGTRGGVWITIVGVSNDISMNS